MQLTNFNSIDGSTYDPFTRATLFTQENGASGGVIEITVDWPVSVRTLDGILGKGGYEGIHPDDQGNLIIIEDAGGSSVAALGGARQPNSFVYRFVPVDRTNLSKGGKLQALQVTVDGTPITFHAGQATADILSDAQLKLHTLGTSYPVKWVTVHDTFVDGFAAFDANARAKAAGASPFKRPENAQFMPGSGFKTFFFDPTGDTTSTIPPEVIARGGYGSIFRVDLDASGESGKISLFLLGTQVMNSFDNLAFVDSNTLLATEDRGDGLHSQLNTLDSIWAFDVRGNGPKPRRFVALGRDTVSATTEDNEPTGLHVSDGDTTVEGMEGKAANPIKAQWFFTQQHGLNQVYEILRYKLN
jgi:secreted PhoX family phosphatase